MQRGATPSTFPNPGLSRPPLVALLAEWGLPATLEGPGGPAAVPSFVDGLAGWLGWADAPRLHAALNLAADAPPVAPARAAAAIEAEAERLRQLAQRLHQAIIDDARRGLPGRMAADAGVAPHRRRHASLQQAMAAALEAPRAALRALLSRLSPAGARLAALDAALEPLLRPREQRLLAMLPLLLERRYEALQARGALRDFGPDMQRLLLAELDLRLQPLHGLLAALQSERPAASPATATHTITEP